MIMNWKYFCLTRSGHETRGVLSGRKEVVLKKLANRGLQIVSLEMDLGRGFLSFFSKKKLSSKTISVFFNDFSSLIGAGIAVNEMLVFLGKMTKKKHIKKTIASIGWSINKGLSLTEAIKDTGCFPWVVINVLSAGEKAGHLEPVMKTSGGFYKNTQKFYSSGYFLSKKTQRSKQQVPRGGHTNNLLEHKKSLRQV